MTKKADFNAEEWETIVEGPPIAGMIVVVAEKGGTFREALKVGQAYEDARKIHIGPELIDELLDSTPSPDPRGYESIEEVHDKGLEVLRTAISILSVKATEEELDAYRGFVMGIAERVAHAHKTGGFLGIGGHKISDKEQLAMDEIRKVIGAHEIPGEDEEE